MFIQTEAIFNTTSGEQVDYDYGEFESLYMADEFHALAPIEPVADTTGPDQDKKEPVYAQDADFGLLDTTGREILSPESEFLKVLRAFDDGHPVESPNDHQSTVIPDVPDIRVDTVTSDSVEIAESSPETENPRDIQPDSSEAQEAAAPDVALSVYEVVEVDEGDDEGDKIKAVQEVDVETDFGDGSVLDLDYVVEEAVTEGRRTMVSIIMDVLGACLTVYTFSRSRRMRTRTRPRRHTQPRISSHLWISLTLSV